MKKRMRAGLSLVLAAATAVLACGCRDKTADVRNAQYTIFHINAEGSGLVESVYTGDMENPEKAVEQMLGALKKPDESIEEQPAIPKKVKVESFQLEDEKLEIYFNAEYGKMDTVQEVLTRAALVRSLTQIPSVSLVAFFVDGSPLTNKGGVELGYMQSEDFVQNTGSNINSYEVTDLTLYFANETGDRLVEETVSVRYNSNLSKEKLIVEQLMKGPLGQGHQRTISQGTKLLGVSVKDGVCYVNFDEGMNRTIPGVKPEIMIYSIINSVTEGGSAGRVQISIDGDSNFNFQESITLSEPLARDLDLVEEKQGD